MTESKNNKKKTMTEFDKMMRMLACGAVSGGVTKTVVAPLERVKILLQIQGMHQNLEAKYNSGIVGSLVTVAREEGFLALYKGNGANVLRILPTYGLKFAFNDVFKEVARGNADPKEPLSFYQLMVSGSLAGLFQITCTYPLELVRTRLSLSTGMRQGIQYNGIWDCTVSTIRSEGWLSLYKGIWPTWISGTPYVGLQMTFYDIFKRFVGYTDEPGNEWANTLRSLVAGAGSGIIAQTLTYPGDTLRRRMQTDGIGGTEAIYKGTMDCFYKTIQNEGVQGLYKGCLANCIRAIPGAAIQFVVYDKMKEILL